MTNQTNQSCNGKWTLGNYSRWAGNFTYSGIFDSPQQACASVGMKAWSYDPQLKKYVPYDPKFGCCRVECAVENNSYSIENTYHVAFRPKIEFTGASGTKTFKPANPSDNLIKVSVISGQKITVSANQPVTWKAVKGAALMGNLLTTGNALSFLPLNLQGSIELRASSVCENRNLMLQLQPANQGNQASKDKRDENCQAAHPEDPAALKKIQHALSFSGGIIPGLTDAQTRAFAANVAQTESAGRFDLSEENQFGYLGLYQFGAVALTDIGYISRAKYDAAVKKYGKKLSNGADAAIHKAFLADAGNWTIKGGKNAYLKDRTIQDKAFIALVNKNLSYAGKAAKAAFNGNPQKTVKYLKMAHLIGATDAAKGIVDPSYDKKDGNGTSMQKYGQGAVQDFDKYTKFVEKAQKCPDK